MLIFPGLRRENVNIQENLADRQGVEKQKNNRKKRNTNNKVCGKTFKYTGRKRKKKKNFQIIKLVTLIAMKWFLSQPLKLTNNSQIFLLYLVCNSNRCVSSKHSGVLIFTL